MGVAYTPPPDCPESYRQKVGAYDCAALSVYNIVILYQLHKHLERLDEKRDQKKASSEKVGGGVGVGRGGRRGRGRAKGNKEEEGKEKEEDGEKEYGV